MGTSSLFRQYSVLRLLGRDAGPIRAPCLDVRFGATRQPTRGGPEFMCCPFGASGASCRRFPHQVFGQFGEGCFGRQVSARGLETSALWCRSVLMGAPVFRCSVRRIWQPPRICRCFCRRFGCFGCSGHSGCLGAVRPFGFRAEFWCCFGGILGQNLWIGMLGFWTSWRIPNCCKTERDHVSPALLRQPYQDH